jgi:hypothetical protein
LPIHIIVLDTTASAAAVIDHGASYAARLVRPSLRARLWGLRFSSQGQADRAESRRAASIAAPTLTVGEPPRERDSDRVGDRVTIGRKCRCEIALRIDADQLFVTNCQAV